MNADSVFHKNNNFSLSCYRGLCNFFQCFCSNKGRGGDLGGTGGTVPPTFQVGDGPCIRPPNILRSSVVGCARKNEQSKNGVIKEFFSEIVVVHVRKGSYTTLNIVKDMENPGKGREILKTWSMTKKGHQKFWPGKCTFFSEKTSFRNLGPRKKISIFLAKISDDLLFF